MVQKLVVSCRICMGKLEVKITSFGLGAPLPPLFAEKEIGVLVPPAAVGPSVQTELILPLKPITVLVFGDDPSGAQVPGNKVRQTCPNPQSAD
jgi:hypothetical protein